MGTSRLSFHRVCAIAVGIVLALIVCYCVFRRSQPVHEGKTSAQWFHEFREASSRHWTVNVPDPLKPPGSIRTLDVEALLREPSARALRHLGTNAAVYLGGVLVREEGLVGRSYRAAYFQLPASLRRVIPEPPPPAPILDMQVGLALQALGPEARAAAPALISLLAKADPARTTSIVRMLKGLPFDRTQLDALLEQWSDCGRHPDIVRVIGDLQVRTAAAAQCLARALTVGDIAVRRSAVNELSHLRADGPPALDSLIVALSDSDHEVRYGAACALEGIGEKAAAAIPALTQLTNDPSIMLQRASARALRTIRGQRQQ